MTVREYKEEIYKLFTEEIKRISDESEKELPEGTWKADINIATDMFLAQAHSEDVQAKIDELHSQVTE